MDSKISSPYFKYTTLPIASAAAADPFGRLILIFALNSSINSKNLYLAMIEAIATALCTVSALV